MEGHLHGLYESLITQLHIHLVHLFNNKMGYYIYSVWQPNQYFISIGNLEMWKAAKPYHIKTFCTALHFACPLVWSGHSSYNAFPPLACYTLYIFWSFPILSSHLKFPTHVFSTPPLVSLCSLQLLLFWRLESLEGKTWCLALEWWCLYRRCMCLSLCTHL